MTCFVKMQTQLLLFAVHFFFCVLLLNKHFLLCPSAADRAIPGGLGGAGRGEHRHPRLPAWGGESVPGAGQGCHTRRLHHRRHGLAQHGCQLPDALLLLVTTSCVSLSAPCFSSKVPSSCSLSVSQPCPGLSPASRPLHYSPLCKAHRALPHVCNKCWTAEWNLQ